jgi:hypothetical protein
VATPHTITDQTSYSHSSDDISRQMKATARLFSDEVSSSVLSKFGVDLRTHEGKGHE